MTPNECALSVPQSTLKIRNSCHLTSIAQILKNDHRRKEIVVLQPIRETSNRGKIRPRLTLLLREDMLLVWPPRIRHQNLSQAMKYSRNINNAPMSMLLEFLKNSQLYLLGSICKTLKSMTINARAWLLRRRSMSPLTNACKTKSQHTMYQ